MLSQCYRHRRGFTLIELSVAMLAGSMLAGALWTLFAGGARHHRNTDERLQAVQAAQTLIERLRSDLASAFVDPGNPLVATAGGLEFLASDPAAPAGYNRPAPDGRLVTYEFDRSSHQVLRNGSPLPAPAYEAVEFEYGAGNTFDPHAARDPRTGRPAANQLLYRITTAAPAVLARDPEGADRRGRITLVGAIRIDQEVFAAHFREWVDHDFEVPAAASS